MKSKKSILKKILYRHWHGTLLHANATIRDAIRILNEVCLKIVLVADARGRLIGTISDGDIRRAMLRGQGLGTPVSKILHRNPLVVHQGHRQEAVIALMLASEVQQIPIVDSKRRIVGLHLWDQLSKNSKRSNLLVIMAGGEGKRLRPFTANRPKPLVKVNGKPIIEHILLKAKKEGFWRFVIAIRYKGSMIKNFLQNGKRWGVNISYCRESKPLGTAGPLRLLKKSPTEPFLVINGDILADFNYADLLDFHVKHRGIATMAVGTHQWQSPYGVVKTTGFRIRQICEKPILETKINAGVYCLDPKAWKLIPPKESIDMTELFSLLKKQKFPTLAFPIHEPWADIGSPQDLLKKNKEHKKIKNN